MTYFEKRLAAPATLSPPLKRFFPVALAGILLRAGRTEEAMARLKQGMASGKGTKIEQNPSDWAYMSLALARNGESAEARRWLQKLNQWRPDSQYSFWETQEIELLRDEAEALTLDADFPTSPFIRLDR
jgi:hypothetical protein